MYMGEMIDRVCTQASCCFVCMKGDALSFVHQGVHHLTMCGVTLITAVHWRDNVIQSYLMMSCWRHSLIVMQGGFSRTDGVLSPRLREMVTDHGL